MPNSQSPPSLQHRAKCAFSSKSPAQKGMEKHTAIWGREATSKPSPMLMVNIPSYLRTQHGMHCTQLCCMSSHRARSARHKHRGILTAPAIRPAGLSCNVCARATGSSPLRGTWCCSVATHAARTWPHSATEQCREGQMGAEEVQVE